MIGDLELEIYRILLGEGERLPVPREKKIEEGVWRMLMDGENIKYIKDKAVMSRRLYCIIISVLTFLIW